jgi:hypothetical protein
LVAAGQQHPKADAIASVLPWLLWPERQSLFDRLMQHAAAEGHDHNLLSKFSEVPDSRAISGLWGLLADPRVSVGRASAVYTALQRNYLGTRHYDDASIAAAAKRRVVADAQHRIDPKLHWQTVTALALMARFKPGQAGELAAGLAADRGADADLRRDAFQLSLWCGQKSDATKAAVAALAGGDAALRRVALAHLTANDQNQHTLGSEFYVQLPDQPDFFVGRRGLSLAAPPGLTAEMVRPLIHDSDADTAARARFLLVLLGQADQLGPLVDAWRTRHPHEDDWIKLVYRAISAADDAHYVPVLKEIYVTLDEYRLSEFYWTIRSMTGPEVLKLRKQMRSEHGASVLR